MAEYRIAETESFQRKIRKPAFHGLYKKITEYAYPLLRDNPWFGPQIKRLKGEFKDVFWFRIGDYRLFYVVREETVLVIILDIEHRKEAYR